MWKLFANNFQTAKCFWTINVTRGAIYVVHVVCACLYNYKDLVYMCSYFYICIFSCVVYMYICMYMIGNSEQSGGNRQRGQDGGGRRITWDHCLMHPPLHSQDAGRHAGRHALSRTLHHGPRWACWWNCWYDIKTRTLTFLALQTCFFCLAASLENFELRMVTQNALRFWNRIAYDRCYQGVAYAFEEGERMARILGEWSADLFFLNLWVASLLDYIILAI